MSLLTVPDADAEPVMPAPAGAREQTRKRARAVLGVHGDTDGPVEPFKAVLARTGVSWYPLTAVSALVVVDQLQANALFILGPNVARALGLDAGDLAVLNSLKGIAAGLATLPMAAAVQNRPWRARIAIGTALLWSLVTLATGLVTGLLFLALVLIVDGASTGSVQTTHQPLLMDSYPPEARVRAFSFFRAADSMGNVIAPLLVALLTAVLAFTWRGVFLVLGVVSFLAVSYAFRLRDPGFGRWDTARVRSLVAGQPQGQPQPQVARAADEGEQIQLRFFEIVRRLLLVPTERRILAAFAVFGVLLFPLQTFIAFYLDERWALQAPQRALFTAATAAGAVAALALFGRYGEALFRRDPARLVDLTSWLLVAAVSLVAVGVLIPSFWIMTLFLIIGSSLVPTLAPAFAITALSIVPPNTRPHAQALMTLATTSVGGFAGALLLGSVERRFGVTVAIASIIVPGVIGSLVLRTARRTVMPDLDRMIDQIVEEEEVSEARASGVPMPLLACRGIDFSYGQLQVLFDVDFSLSEGEMVGLLGVNGAGKSTLLRVISGLGLPQRGSVRLEGRDITYLDPERRMRLGISQISGGKAVFGPLSVVDNLRLYGHTMRSSSPTIESAIDSAFEAFPRLAERRESLAQTLSGGEQQMLALSKAIMLRPKLLVIDELSLGLAPIVVAQLLKIVRELNKQGTAVIIVEQSVNVALSLVQHAYFMEKGEIRFDGPSRDLLAREDLLRSVFLHGTAGQRA